MGIDAVIHMKEEWKYAMEVNGRLYVMITGERVMHKWYALNLDTSVKVYYTHEC